MTQPATRRNNKYYTMDAADEATENFAEVMNRALADAAKAEAERDVLAARVAELEARLDHIAHWSVPADETKRFRYDLTLPASVAVFTDIDLATVHSFGVEYWPHASGDGTDMGALCYRTEKSGQQFFLPLTLDNVGTIGFNRHGSGFRFWSEAHGTFDGSEGISFEYGDDVLGEDLYAVLA